VPEHRIVFYRAGHLGVAVAYSARAKRLAATQAGLLLASRANPAKVEDFCDEDLLQHIDLARFLFGLMISSSREAR